MKKEKKKILSQIFGLTRSRIREWRKIFKEELHSSYRSSNIVKLIKFRRLKCSARMEGRTIFKILTGKVTGKRPPSRPKRRWDGNLPKSYRNRCQRKELG